MTTPGERDAAIDALRGLAVLAAAIGNFAMGVEWVPTALKHAPDLGFTIADLVAPIFVLAMGFTVRPSMERRRSERGTRAAVIHQLRRSLALIGIGSVISVGQAMLRPQPGIDLTWGVLQALGAANLLLLPVVFLPTWARLLSGLACLGVFQWLLDHYWLGAVLHASHNGIRGSISWAGLLMLATVVSDLDRRWAGRRPIVVGAAAATALAVALLATIWIPVSKHRASATYMLLSMGLGLLLLVLLDRALARSTGRLPDLQRMGRNPLLLYLADLLLLAVVTLPSAPAWHAQAPPWLTLLQGGVIVVATVALARALDRRGHVVRL